GLGDIARIAMRVEIIRVEDVARVGTVEIADARLGVVAALLQIEETGLIAQRRTVVVDEPIAGVLARHQDAGWSDLQVWAPGSARVERDHIGRGIAGDDV